MFKKGKYFYIADANSSGIYKVNAADFTVEGVYVLPEFRSSTNRISGMAWDGKSLWICADGMQKILRRSLKNLEPINVK